VVNSNSNAAGLPRVISAIVIDGNGSTITREPSAPQFRILEVAGNGNLTLEETTVTGGVSPSQPGGGGVLNEGTVALTRSTVSGWPKGGCCAGS
jgi:hypothetical protein